MSIRVEHGDSRDVLKALADASIDAVVTDPPYALVSMTKPRPDLTGKNNQFARRQAAAGFMGKQWDTGETAFDPAFWAEVLRVLKPGGHLVAFGGTRTYHRLVCAIEDGGFEIRDQIGWAFGSGFPKSHDVSKGIDKAAGAEREPDEYSGPNDMNNVYGKNMGGGITLRKGAATTDAARQWQGWGTALKPAWEPVCLARKPLIGTVAANVLAHGTGALNIDGCRVEGEKRNAGYAEEGAAVQGNSMWGNKKHVNIDVSLGRWPANLILSYPVDEYLLRTDATREEKAALYRWMSENT